MTIPLIAATLIGVLLSLAGLLGIRAAWKVGQTAQTLTNYKEAAASWEATANALRQELANFKEVSNAAMDVQHKALDAATSTIETLKLKVGVLEDTLTGHSVMVELAGSVHSDIEALRADIRVFVAGLGNGK